MKFQLVVSTPVGAEFVTNMYNRRCEVIIGKMKTQTDIVKLGEMEYEHILGMDWLSTCHAHVICHQKRITFKLEEAPEYVFERKKDKLSISIISAIKTTTLLRHRCRGFLTITIDKKDNEVRIEDNAVVREYPDAFSKNLPG